VVTVDLSPLRGIPEGSTVGMATLGYSDASTVHRSPGGNAEYGILPTCNTRLGVAADTWNGTLDGLVPTRPAATAGASGATTGDAGSWDVTPQVREWLSGPNDRRTFVMQGADESLDVKELGMCLSYVFDVAIAAELRAEE